jgi:glycosyltransferase involved in cell wall biosynthesis
MTRPQATRSLTGVIALNRTARALARHAAIRTAAWWLRFRRFARTAAPPCSNSLAVIGFLETASGIGTAGRGLLTALAPLRPLPISIDDCALTPRLPIETAPTNSAASGCRVALAAHIYNPDIFLRLVRTGRSHLIQSPRINLAIVNWETNRLPPSWRCILSLYDILCAPSSFTAAAVQRATGRPVHVVPNCVPVQPLRKASCLSGHFAFLSLFDHLSDFDRKNPLAAIRAFVIAARQLPSGVSCRLRLKCHANTPPELVARLRMESEGAPIEILARTLSPADMEVLWGQSDCLISLHRSEGFGLPVAEAIARGIPVIATRQGGILDFVDDSSGFLIDGHASRSLGTDSSYPEWSGWIEPDIDTASQAIRAVMVDYDRAATAAMHARERLSHVTSQTAVLEAFQRAAASR